MKPTTKQPLLGDLPSLNDLFEDFKYCRNVVTPGEGSRTIKPDGYYFAAIRPHSWRGVKPGGPQNWVLYAKPTPLALQTAQNNTLNGKVGSFEVIPWHDSNQALIVARDTLMISHAWIAFVPLAEVPSPEFFLNLPLEGI